MHSEDSTKILDIIIDFREEPSVRIDSENAEINRVMIGEFEAVVSDKENTICIAWSDTERGLVFTVFGDNMDMDTESIA